MLNTIEINTKSSLLNTLPFAQFCNTMLERHDSNHSLCNVVGLHTIGDGIADAISTVSCLLYSNIEQKILIFIILLGNLFIMFYGIL